MSTELGRSKKGSNVRGKVLVADLLVIGAIGKHQLLIGAQKGTGVGAALVPDQHTPAAGLQDADKFVAGFCWIEPVGCLGGSDQVNAVVGESGGLGDSGHADKFVIPGEQALARP